MPEEREAMGEFFKAGLIDTFRTLHPEEVKYSWWNQLTRARDRNIGWRLDHFFVSPDLKDRVVSADIHTEVMGSDHCPVSLSGLLKRTEPRINLAEVALSLARRYKSVWRGKESQSDQLLL
jgi:hypothetical protein